MNKDIVEVNLLCICSSGQLNIKAKLKYSIAELFDIYLLGQLSVNGLYCIYVVEAE